MENDGIPRPDPQTDGAPGTTARGTVQVSLEANSNDVREALARVISSLPATEGDMAMRLEVVLAEALNNVVEHAYLDSGQGKISVSSNWDADELRCQIIDHGCAMPGLKLPQGSPPNLDVDVQDLPEGGFGWFMIHKLTHDLTYDRSDDRNVLTFCLHW